MLSSLFGGMNVHNMSVNVNFNGSNLIAEQMRRNQMLFDSYNVPKHLLEGDKNNKDQILLDGKSTIIKESKIIIGFDKCYITSDYKLNTSNHPQIFEIDDHQDIYSSLNSNYVVNVPIDNLPDSTMSYSYKKYNVGEILIREYSNTDSLGDFTIDKESKTIDFTGPDKKLPPIVTILDIQENEGYIFDDIMIHVEYYCKLNNINNFFLVLEESGEMVEGEPFTVKFRDDKGLFKKEIYNIKI